jgi:hypothetical protein
LFLRKTNDCARIGVVLGYDTIKENISIQDLVIYQKDSKDEFILLKATEFPISEACPEFHFCYDDND